MSPKLYLLFVLLASTAARYPARIKEAKRLCGSIVDCEACLLIPTCYAAFRPMFDCHVYPVDLPQDNNATIIVEDVTCCPTSRKFAPEMCGFGADNFKTDQVLDKWTKVGIIAAAAVIAIIILSLAVALSIKACTRRYGKLKITNNHQNVPDEASGANFNNKRPSTSASAPPPPALPPPNKRRPQVTTTAYLASTPNRPKMPPTSSLQDEIKSASAASWNLRRSTMKGHPLDQSRQ